jgi:hypothetical protein
VRLPAPGRAPLLRIDVLRPRTALVARRTGVLLAMPLRLTALYLVNSARRACHLVLKNRGRPPSAGESFVPLFLPGQLRPSLSILVPIADPELSCFSLILRSRQPSPNNPNRKTLRLDLCAFLPIASCVDLGWGAGFMLCDLVLCVVPVAELPRRWRQ